MSIIAPIPYDDDDAAGAGYEPLTAEQAQQFRQENPSLSPWWVVAGQLVVGLVLALAGWALTGRANIGWSTGYGALAVMIPAAVFVRGFKGRRALLRAGAAVVRFFLWEMVKMGLTLAMLLAAPRLIMALSWPAMLVGLAGAMQVYWVALLFASRRKN
ncbi:MAG: ATP synthase subunit I [Burkholderiaceae bacterium]|nr:MAG: ATP synthase subunit I [Burkholderiaceae bacterium]